MTGVGGEDSDRDLGEHALSGGADLIDGLAAPSPAAQRSAPPPLRAADAQDAPLTQTPDADERETGPGQGAVSRGLRAVFAADMQGFGVQVSLDESGTLTNIVALRALAAALLERHGGDLFGLPGDGIFATFFSSTEAVACALSLQGALADNAAETGDAPLPLRIGVHVGDVLYRDGQPFGEALAIAARLEALADPGGVLVSRPVVDTVALRLPVRFEAAGAPELKNMSRQLPVFRALDPERARVSERDMAEIEAALVDVLGPVGRVIVRKAAAEAATRDALLEVATQAVADPRQAAAFHARLASAAPRSGPST